MAVDESSTAELSYPDNDPARILAETSDSLSRAFAVLEWAEDEIQQAQERHPAQADLLYHGFGLLAPRAGMPELTGTEFVYRGHARELLERLAAGEDTRPGTDAEICVAMCHVTLATPVRPEAAGLYARAWVRAFPDHSPWGDRDEHYEALYAGEIDDAEAMARRKLADPDRVVGQPDCSGRHHGEPAAQCRFHGVDRAPARKRRKRSQ